MKSAPSIIPFHSRRFWVKQFVLASAATLSGARWMGSVLAEVTSTGPGPAVVRLKVNDIRANGTAVLAQAGGSVKYQFHDFIKPLIINRVSSDRFVALDSRCTHQGCSVGKFVVEDQRMRCPCHGSRYDIEGRVFRDANGDSTEPASDDLARFVTSYDAATDVVSVVLPEIQLSVRSISVHQRSASGVMRLKLVFPATAFATYEVQSAATPAGPFARVPFSLSPNTKPSLLTFMPENDGDLTVYIDATGERGFFAVGLVLTPL